MCGFPIGIRKNPHAQRSRRNFVSVVSIHENREGVCRDNTHLEILAPQGECFLDGPQ
jgi:hypothetical protein